MPTGNCAATSGAVKPPKRLGHENHVRPVSNRADHDPGIVVQTQAFVVTGQVHGDRLVARTLKERRELDASTKPSRQRPGSEQTWSFPFRRFRADRHIFTLDENDLAIFFYELADVRIQKDDEHRLRRSQRRSGRQGVSL